MKLFGIPCMNEIIGCHGCFGCTAAASAAIATWHVCRVAAWAKFCYMQIIPDWQGEQKDKGWERVGAGKPTGDLALYVSNLTTRTVMDISISRFLRQ